MSKVTLNLVLLAGEEGTQTRARGRENVLWRTFGTPEVQDKNRKKQNLVHMVLKRNFNESFRQEVRSQTKTKTKDKLVQHIREDVSKEFN